MNVDEIRVYNERKKSADPTYNSKIGHNKTTPPLKHFMALRKKK